MFGAKIKDLPHSLQVLPKKFLSDLQNDPSLRGAGRLYLYIRRHIGSKYHPESQRGLLKEHFSNYQITKYLSVLVAKKMMRRDQAGNYYLTSLYTLCPSEYVGEARRKSLCVALSDETLLDGKLFKDVIAGVVVAAYTRSLRYGRTRKRATCFAATNDPMGIHSVVYKDGAVIKPSALANSSIVQGCSLSILARHTGRHKSTMSRWRKKGQAVGYSLCRWYYKVQDELTPAYLDRLKHSGQWSATGLGVDLNRLVVKDGKVLIEAPSQLVFDVPLFFTK